MLIKFLLNGKEINLTSEKMKVKSDFLDINENGKVTLTGDANFDPNNPQIEDYVFKVISPDGDNIRASIQPNIVNLGNGSATVNIQVGTVMNPASNTSNITVSSINKYVTASVTNASSSITLGSWSDSSTRTTITDSRIEAQTITQTSLESQKKNFEKLENALEIIKNVDIYKYNLKSQTDGDKRHIGFVIGDDYKYSKELTSSNNDGVDIYSLASCCLAGLQEQQKLIEQLQNEIKQLKEEK